MKFNFKEYQKKKTKKYFKNNNLILLSNNANQKSQNWKTIEQELTKLKLNYHKIHNKTTKKIIKNSINRNVVNIINSTFFLLKPVNNKILIKPNTFQHLNLIFFIVLAFKLNQKIYSTPQSKKIITYYHKKNLSILYQFCLTNLKHNYFLKKF